MTAARTSRTRIRGSQERVVRNTESLLDAAEQVLASEGWSQLTFAAVGERAGLSRRTLQDRFAGPSTLAAAVWSRRSAPALEDAMRHSLAAAGLLGDGAAGKEHLADSLSGLVTPDTALLAAGELLVMSQFDPEVGRAVKRGLARRVSGWCTPKAGTVTRGDAGRRAYVVCLCLGLILAGRSVSEDPPDMSVEFASLWQALASGRDPVELPRTRATHLDGPTPLETGDSIRDALLAAVIESVGAVGYDSTTVATVAAAAGYSQGAVFSRYGSKLAMFVDATRAQNESAFKANHDFIEALAIERGRGIAEAVTIREFQRPGREHLRAILLEQMRVMWHEPELMAAHMTEREVAMAMVLKDGAVAPDRAAGHFHFGYALGLGAPALVLLCPTCWTIPFDVVTVLMSCD